MWNLIWVFTHSWYGVRWQQRKPYMTWELPSTQTVSEEARRKNVALYGWRRKKKSQTAEAHLLSKTKSPSYLDSGISVLRLQSPLLGNEFEYWYKQACLYLLPCCRELEKRKRMRDTYCLMSPREDASYTWSYARVKKTLPWVFQQPVHNYSKQLRSLLITYSTCTSAWVFNARSVFLAF